MKTVVKEKVEKVNKLEQKLIKEKEKMYDGLSEF